MNSWRTARRSLLTKFFADENSLLYSRHCPFKHDVLVITICWRKHAREAAKNRFLFFFQEVRQDPLIWVLVIFAFFAPWYRNSREPSSVKIAETKSKEKLVKCATKVARFYRVSIQSCTKKSAVSESSITLARLNLTFLPLELFTWNLAHLFSLRMTTKLASKFLFLPTGLVMVFQSRKIGKNRH